MEILSFGKLRTSFTNFVTLRMTLCFINSPLSLKMFFHGKFNLFRDFVLYIIAKKEDL